MIEEIKEYFSDLIHSKKKLEKDKRILENQIEIMIKNQKEYKNSKDHALDQMNKYKTELNKNHIKFCEYEIHTQIEIANLEKEIKSLKRKNRKLEKELKNVQV